MKQNKQEQIAEMIVDYVNTIAKMYHNDDEMLGQEDVNQIEQLLSQTRQEAITTTLERVEEKTTYISRTFMWDANLSNEDFKNLVMNRKKLLKQQLQALSILKQELLGEV